MYYFRSYTNIRKAMEIKHKHANCKLDYAANKMIIIETYKEETPLLKETTCKIVHRAIRMGQSSYTSESWFVQANILAKYELHVSTMLQRVAAWSSEDNRGCCFGIGKNSASQLGFTSIRKQPSAAEMLVLIQSRVSQDIV